MTQKKTYVTKEGLEELKKEYEKLTRTKRPQLVERVAQARDMGDLSENAEYHAAREELAFVDGRIDELAEILKQVEIIGDNKSVKASQVKVGSTVTIKSKHKTTEFIVVGEWEADPAQKKISHESPLGQALIGKGVGEQVEVEAPAGKIAYTITNIK